MILFAVIPTTVLLCLLWGPTLFVILQKKPSGHDRIRTIPISVAVEVLVVVGLSFLAEWVGLVNPAGYVLLITLATSIVGAISVYYLLQAP